MIQIFNPKLIIQNRLYITRFHLPIEAFSESVVHLSVYTRHITFLDMV